MRYICSNDVLPQFRKQPSQALQSALKWMKPDIPVANRIAKASAELKDYPELAEFLRDSRLVDVLLGIAHTKITDLSDLISSIQSWVGSPHQQVSRSSSLRPYWCTENSAVQTLHQIMIFHLNAMHDFLTGVYVHTNVDKAYPELWEGDALTLIGKLGVEYFQKTCEAEDENTKRLCLSQYQEKLSAQVEKLWKRLALSGVLEDEAPTSEQVAASVNRLESIQHFPVLMHGDIKHEGDRWCAAGPALQEASQHQSVSIRRRQKAA